MLDGATQSRHCPLGLVANGQAFVRRSILETAGGQSGQKSESYPTVGRMVLSYYLRITDRPGPRKRRLKGAHSSVDKRRFGCFCHLMFPGGFLIEIGSN